MKPGDRVIYTSCSEDQINWGGNDDPREVLEVGKEYIINSVEVHTWHTKVELNGISGQFNSVCFEPAGGTPHGR